MQFIQVQSPTLTHLLHVHYSAQLTTGYFNKMRIWFTVVVLTINIKVISIYLCASKADRPFETYKIKVSLAIQ